MSQKDGSKMLRRMKYLFQKVNFDLNLKYLILYQRIEDFVRFVNLNLAKRKNIER